MRSAGVSGTAQTESSRSQGLAVRRITRALRWCGIGLWRVLQFVVITWGTLAVYYSNLPWGWARGGLAVGFAVFAVWSLWVARRHRARWKWGFAGVYAGVLVWWVCIPALHDRVWRAEVAVLPRAVIEGDRVRISGVRAFRWRSRDDFDVRYEEREISLGHVSGVDLFVSYWKPGPVAHTFLSFTFDDGAPPLCISIEARPEVGESFATLPAMFKRFELVYVVGDERDLVGVRTGVRNEDVYLYRVRSTPEGARKLLGLYLSRINAIAERPEWYHLLSNNCTVNILRDARAAGAGYDRFDHRYLFNGLVDHVVYNAGAVDTSVSFEELRERSRITDVARAAGGAADFSARIREGIAGPARGE